MTTMTKTRVQRIMTKQPVGADGLTRNQRKKQYRKLRLLNTTFDPIPTRELNAALQAFREIRALVKDLGIDQHTAGVCLMTKAKPDGITPTQWKRTMHRLRRD